MSISSESFINSFQFSQRDPGIVGLMMDILVLDQRLKALDEQSEYFGWSIPSQSRQLIELVSQYNQIRDVFNHYTVPELQDEINAQESAILAHGNITPMIARHMFRSRAERIVQEMKAMIDLKSVMDTLPTIDEIKNQSELLEALLRVK